MSARLILTDPGAMTTVQDLGRTGYRGQGVPLTGVLDRVGLRLVNALLGNDPGEAALEVRLTAPRLTVDGGPVRLALDGALTGSLTTAEGSREVSPWSTVTLAPGEDLTLRALDGALVGLIGVAGGLDIAPVLGSRSTHVRSGIGGWEGRPLRAGDRLPLRAPAPPGAERRYAQPFRHDTGPIRVILGPQEDHFTEDGLAAFLSEPYEVTRELDRMGIRLSGAEIGHRPERTADLPSEGMAPGCIQVPGSGQPILVLADGQTVGGYAKPATVISADLPRLAALRPGDKITFAAVDFTQALEALGAQDKRVQAAIASIAENTLVDGYDLTALFGGNLIDGVVDMTRPDHFPGHLES